MSEATLLTDRSTTAVRLERRLPDPPHVVWHALTDELPAAAAARNAAGWDACLDRLAGIEPAGGGWQARFDAYASRFEPVIGSQEGPPAGYKGDLDEQP
jgi:hypothetical protein